MLSNLLPGILFSPFLGVWGPLYLVGVTEGVLEAAHWLAYSKIVTTLAGPDGLARANAQIGFGESAGSVIAPLAAGLLLKLAGLPAVLDVDGAALVAWLTSVNAELGELVLPSGDRLKAVARVE